MARYAQILSTGCDVPERVLTNQELSALLGEDVDRWLRDHVGIHERRIMAPEDATSDLIVRAAAQALSRAGLSPADLDLLIVATDTPDYLSPATASVVQHKLGAANAGCFDINAACAGWVAALDVAARYLATEPSCHHALVAGGYGMTRFVDWRDKTTCTLFADGAGAVVLGAGKEPGFLSGKLLGRGEYHDALGIYTGGTFRPAVAETVAASGPPTVRFVRKFPRTFNVDHWPPLIQEVVDRAGLTLAQVDLFLFTQLNLRTIEQVMERLGQPMSKTHFIMDRWGYTGSACLPMALDDALRGGRAARGLPGAPRPGDHVVFCASGGGLALGASVWRWTSRDEQLQGART